MWMLEVLLFSYSSLKGGIRLGNLGEPSPLGDDSSEVRDREKPQDLFFRIVSLWGGWQKKRRFFEKIADFCVNPHYNTKQKVLP